ncbi:DUF4156 domain-containing protein [Halobacteriovorax sp. GFR7]|uniref:DUF4156 domain-containing protein n=1 Tax=unclassified Halobacteriovorax TaxID=2639665 RepID=UPI003D96BFAA
MKKFFILFSVLLTALMMTSCSTAKLSTTGQDVEVVYEKPDMLCKNMGPVFGKGGGSFGGSWITDEKLMEYASNDIRNKASAKGATHVHVTNHQMGQTSGQYGGTTSTATFSGVAYKCHKKSKNVSRN